MSASHEPLTPADAPGPAQVQAFGPLLAPPAARLPVSSTGLADPAGPTVPARRDLKIGDLSQRLGLTTRTLRYWEERGLLPPPRRSAGGTRLYTSEHLRAARGILRLKVAGFSLDEIADLQTGLRTRGTALQGMTVLDAAIAGRQQELRDRIREQEILLAELEAARRCAGLCDGCHGKLFDADCTTCLEDASQQKLPDCLRSVLQSANAVSGGQPPREAY